MQWMADGQVAIISHDREEDTFCCTQGKEEVGLSEAASEGYCLSLGKKVAQHVGDCACHIPDF